MKRLSLRLKIRFTASFLMIFNFKNSVSTFRGVSTSSEGFLKS